MPRESLTVLQVHLVDGSESGCLATCRSLAGEELGTKRLQWEDTVQDLEDAVRGLCSWHAQDLLTIHRMDEAHLDLKRTSLLRHLESEMLVVGKVPLGEVGAILEQFPFAGKILKAMKDSAFDPRSPNFDVRWTGARANAVNSFDTWNLLSDIFPDLDSASKLRFLRIFGHLSSDMESWNMLNLWCLQHHDPGLEHFKHEICKNWLEVACLTAADRIPAKPSSICVLLKNRRGQPRGIKLMGHTHPFADNQNLMRQMDVNDARVSSQLKEGLRALLCLDPNRNGDGEWDPVEAAKRMLDSEVPVIEGDDVLRLVHVQLLLSSLGVAEVEGEMDPNHVQFLADCMRYRFYFVDDERRVRETVQSAIAEFEKGKHRGILLLVRSDMAQRESISPLMPEVKESSVPLRVIFCHSSSPR